VSPVQGRRAPFRFPADPKENMERARALRAGLESGPLTVGACELSYVDFNPSSGCGSYFGGSCCSHPYRHGYGSRKEA